MYYEDMDDLMLSSIPDQPIINDEKKTFITKAAFIEFIKALLIIFAGLVPFWISFIAIKIFNEIIVYEALYQIALMIIPFLVSQFFAKIDFPVLYIRELRLVKT